MIDLIRFDEKGLVPAIIQDVNTNEVLMLAYMNRESLEKTLATGNTWFYSRSRRQLWMKGETSGHVQQVKDIRFDCDADTLLIKVEQTGAACHTGHYSCFYRNQQGEEVSTGASDNQPGTGILYELQDIIRDRQKKMPEGSYTTYLFDKGIDKILKKVGEESAEVIIAAKNRSKDEVRYEVSDLFYHVLVLLVEQGVDVNEIFTELKSRR